MVPSLPHYILEVEKPKVQVRDVKTVTSVKTPLNQPIIFLVPLQVLGTLHEPFSLEQVKVYDELRGLRLLCICVIFIY